jgi:hypothetical protein
VGDGGEEGDHQHQIRDALEAGDPQSGSGHDRGRDR